jgi:septum formation protein
MVSIRTCSQTIDPIMALVHLILASASPRRAELLRAAGFEFDTIIADVDEAVQPGESPATYVRRVAAEKSAYVASGLASYVASGGVILAADTAVVVDGEILGKPRDEADAASMLRKLAGRRHEVLTGVSLRHGAYELGRVEMTAVFFSALSEHDVAWYVASGEGRDKAGGYAIQGLASRFIHRIEGSYSNVVGLPVAAVVELLREIGGIA